MRESARTRPSAPSAVRCAIYTRKSTEEGLEQEFNSLDAQRESAEAFIASQRHLGWTVIAQRYDDGGYSGGNLERPALRQLLEDVEAGRIDCVVVYKVDRLSRSLLDFARLMDCFEQRQVSFVSVTQQFNTTTSLGRLTLNILLSFAQFEREIISERTRDKMGAARRKGKWVGGTPLLGYDVHPQGGRLVVNPEEARRVREIFELYERSGSLAEVVEQLAERGWTTKCWKSRRGVRHAGRPFTKASLRLLLTNAAYAGHVVYRGVSYQGEHPAIVERALWETVNAGFRERCRTEGPAAVRGPQNALLTGLLYCQSCRRPMVATYAAKDRWRYRYYVCQSAQQKGWHSCPTKSVSARRIEDSLVSQLTAHLSASSSVPVSAQDWGAFLEGNPSALIHQLIEQIHYDGAADRVRVQLRRLEETPDETTLAFQYRLLSGRNRALPVFQPEAAKESVNQPTRLAQLLVLAHQLEAQVRSGQVADYRELARQAHVSAARIGQIVTLAQLAPDIQEYVLFLADQHTARISELSLRNIAREMRWDRQRARFRKLTAHR